MDAWAWIQSGINSDGCHNPLTRRKVVEGDINMLNLRTFGYGHSFGVISHYYGREPGLELREDVDTVLQPGMILSMEPMLMIPEGQPGAVGYRGHDCLIIHHDGTVENVTKFPFGPEHNVVKCN